MGKSTFYAFLTLGIAWLAAAHQANAQEVMAGPLRLEANDHSLSITKHQQLVLEYRHSQVPFKPYVKQFLSPTGMNVLRDAPHDHLHHHALMFAIGVDGVDFWAEARQSGRQIHRGFSQYMGLARGEEASVSFVENLDWVDAGQQVILKERRAISLYQAAASAASLLTWQALLEPAAGRDAVQLTGSHYFGLGMRFLQSMDKTGTWIYPQDRSPEQIVRGDERLIRADWCAYVATADGKKVTVAMFDHPGNPRHPAHWFTMKEPFSYLSATLNLWKEPLSLRKGESLDLCYGVAVWDGVASFSQIAELYQQWVDLAPASRQRRP